jgi:succinate dehydrogenase / fumarate reductase, flavoprotein subunit
MEVAPTAHYSMGGVDVDAEEARTDLEGLYAAGEVTAGLHGANRLGGNSLTETVVFGARAGAAAAARSRTLRAQPRPLAAREAAEDELDAFPRDGDVLPRLAQHDLRELMWRHVGVVRDAEGLEDGLQRLEELRGAVDDLDVGTDAEGHREVALALELRASLDLAVATAAAALRREESRGSHQRRDHPDRDDDHGSVHHTVRLGPDGELGHDRRRTGAVPDHLEDWARDDEAPDTEGRLLE